VILFEIEMESVSRQRQALGLPVMTNMTPTSKKGSEKSDKLWVSVYFQIYESFSFPE
jgi:hypothetical protein